MTRAHPVLVSVCVLSFACDDQAADVSRRVVREEHAPEIRRVVLDDLARHRRGVRTAAERLAPGFGVVDPAVREREMRAALRRIQEPPRGIPEFVASPMSFLAAVGDDGKVIARDAEPDPMRGSDFAGRFPVVARALRQGDPGFDLGDFPSGDANVPASVSILFVQPAMVDGRTVGAVVAGIPLWRMAQRLGRQLQVEQARPENDGLILWVYLYRGASIYHKGTPAELDAAVPDVRTREDGLARSPGGFTGRFRASGRNYGWGVVPLPSIGEGVGAIVLRSEPP